MSNQNNRAYWMLADTELPIARDPTKKSSFEAHFKHGLLFNEQLMISDAQAVNCTNLRKLVAEGGAFKNLLTSNLLSIAVRDPNGLNKCQSLVEVRDAFFNENKQNMEDLDFKRDDDLAILNSSCEIVPYTYSSLRDNYTQSVLDIFQSEKAKEIFGNDTQQLLLERLYIEEKRDNGLGRVFLHKNFETDLAKLKKQQIWNEYKDKIIKLSDAPYVTGIPKVLNTNPIYSPLHQESFELAFPSSPTIIETIKHAPIEISTNLNLSTYENALAKLDPEDIFDLRSSVEFRKYQAHIKTGVSNENQLDNALDALIAYQKLIDERIIKRHLGRKVGRTYLQKRFVEPLRKIAQEGGVFALGLSLTDVATGGALSIANFFVSEFIGGKEKLNENNLAREKVKLIQVLEAQPNLNKVHAQKNISPNMNETIYSSVT